MWSETLPNGKVRFVERYENPMTEKSHKVSVTMDKDTASTRKLAQAALNDKIDAKLSSTATIKKDALRLSELIELYRTDQKATVTKSTYQQNYFAMDSLMRILGQDILADKITAGYVREKLAAENEKSGTINERITRLKALMRWGYQNDYIADIRWLDKIKKFKDDEKVQKLEEKYLESNELKERFYCGHRSELFMCDVNVDYLNYYSYNKYLQENARQLFGKTVTTYFMRHTHVSLMAEQGVPPDVISRRLGHSDSRITMNIYFHVTKKMREKDNQKIKGMSIL